ncbi:MAG TPA: acyltransferase family protein [Sphingomonas sp.]|jgi:hypothetical protein|nr:acyltransferase family protein [Sphingomonas sp.]
MDWLRIGAFGLLILYHIGMVFVPWNFHVKSHHIYDWLKLPMMATNAWRLTLLFVVSGYASRALLARQRGPGQRGPGQRGAGRFAVQRTWRLLVPLTFGMILIVPPQPWVEFVTKFGYPLSFPSFWLHHYFRFAVVGGVMLPAWNHLWFVLYLWAYTLVLAAGVAIVRTRRLQAVFDRLFGGWGLLILPALWYTTIHGWLFLMSTETQRLIDDPMGHLSYLPAFLFGFGLARSPAALAAAVRLWKPAAVMALIGYATIVAIELHWPGDGGAPRWVYRPYGIAHAIEQWAAIIALIGVAEAHWNRDARVRPMLTEAVFPFYIVHQTIIVVVMYWLLPAGLPGWAEAGVLIVATVAGCWAFYLVGRAIPPLRPLIGLRRHAILRSSA